MTASNEPTRVRSETLYSPALYLKELKVVEDIGSRGSHLLSGTRVKSIVIPILFWMLKHLPLVVALAPVRVVIGLTRLLYVWRNNPLRKSCEYICGIAQAAGHVHSPKQVYQQYLSNALGIVQNYFQLYRTGVDSVIDRVEFATEQSEMLNQLSHEYAV